MTITLIDRRDKELLMAAGWQVSSILQEQGRLPMFLTVSGSHSHGLETPESDIDIRGIYLDPTSQVLSIHRGKDTVEGNRGNIDYQCYEFGKLLGMLLNNNGNVVRMLLSPLVLYSLPSIDWVDLGKKFLTKKLRFYYRGYAESQRKRAMSERGGKALIYTYREMFEGFAVMVLGEPMWDFKELWKWVLKQGYYKGGMLESYFGQPKKEVSDEGWRVFYEEWQQLCDVLDAQAELSSLPDDYDGFNELDSLLQMWRLRGLFLPEARPGVEIGFVPRRRKRGTDRIE